ncbi:MAG: hypothetical protein ACI8T1_002416 [Verrucomicrobiales bacterium]|jgi:hypothetical protein
MWLCVVGFSLWFLILDLQLPAQIVRQNIAKRSVSVFAF